MDVSVKNSTSILDPSDNFILGKIGKKNINYYWSEKCKNTIGLKNVRYYWPEKSKSTIFAKNVR